MAARQYKVYSDSAFVTGDSPVVLDINTDLGHAATNGYFDNYGSGDLTIELSDNGTDYDGAILLRAGDVFNIEKIKNPQVGVDQIFIKKIRVTWVSDTSYKVFVS